MTTKIIAAALGFLSAFTASAPAHAEVYCYIGRRPVVYDGGTFNVDWDVTADGARKQRPDQAQPSRGCRAEGTFADGMHRHPEMIAKPQQGEARVLNRSSVGFRSNAPGRDRFTLRVHWMQGATPQSAIINFNVTVFPRAL